MSRKRILEKRMPKELLRIKGSEALHGITCSTKGDAPDDFSELVARLPGPKDSPYEGATYEVSVISGGQYPFRPPTFKFITPIYHPNIDNSGNICLDLLSLQPAGSYNPSITLESLLLSIQLLLATPNVDDPLNGEAADLYKSNHEEYLEKVKELVQKQKAKSRPKEPDQTEEEVPTKVKRTESPSKE